MYIDLGGLAAAILLFACLRILSKILYSTDESRSPPPSDRVGYALYHSQFQLNHLVPLVNHGYLRPEGIDDEIIERCIALYRFGLTRALAVENDFSLKEQSSAYRKIGKEVRKKERDLAKNLADKNSADPALKFVSLGEKTYREFVTSNKDRELIKKKTIKNAKMIVRQHCNESNFLHFR